MSTKTKKLNKPVKNKSIKKNSSPKTENNFISAIKDVKLSLIKKHNKNKKEKEKNETKESE